MLDRVTSTPLSTAAVNAQLLFEMLAEVRYALAAWPEQSELLDELESVMRSLWFYSIFNASAVVTIAGPQGVGKSSLANRLLRLTPASRLPEGEGSCEHLPVVLCATTEAHASPVEVFRLTGWEARSDASPSARGQAIPVFTTERLTYAAGRERAMCPQPTDMFIRWNVNDSEALRRVSPLVVLPGLELSAPWADGIRFVLDLSDVILFAVDFRRKAQAEAAKLEEWIKASEPAVRPIVVATKTDMLTESQRASFDEVLSAGPFEHVATGVAPGGKSLGDEQVWSAIVDALASLAPRSRHVRLKRLILRAARVLDGIDKHMAKAQERTFLTELTQIDKVLKDFDERWEILRENVVKPRVKEVLDEHQSASVTAAQGAVREHITEGAWNKLTLFFVGLPELEQVTKVEKAIESKLLVAMRDKVPSLLGAQLKALPAPEGAPADPNLQFRHVASVVLTEPPGRIQQQAQSLAERFHEATEDSKALANDGKTLLDRVHVPVGGTPKKGKRGGNASRNGTVALATALAGAEGGSASAMEVAGLGVSGTTASVLVGIAGAVVAGAAVISFVSAVVRNSRHLEYKLDEYSRQYASAVRNELERSFHSRLDQYFVILRSQVRDHLYREYGLEASARNTHCILSATAQARQGLQDVRATQL